MQPLLIRKYDLHHLYRIFFSLIGQGDRYNFNVKLILFPFVWWIKSPERKFSIPDWLAISRIIAAPILLLLLITNERLIFSSLLLFCFLTDALDGYLARKMNITTERGAQLDSLGDAMAFTLGVAGICWFEFDFVREQLFWILLAFGIYLGQLLLAWWRYGMPSSFHTYLAKLAAILQGTFICWLLFIDVQYWLFYLAITVSILETQEEIILIFIFPKWKANVKGLIWVLRERKK